MEDYAALDLKYHLLRGEDASDDLRRQSINAYYHYLTQYHNWLLNHIHKNKKYALTLSTPDGFEEFYTVHRKHDSILGQHGNPLTVGQLINATMTELFPIVRTLKEKGASDYFYEFAIDNMLINKFRAFSAFAMDMAQGGPTIINNLLPQVSSPLGVNGIYSNLCKMENELELTEEQKRTVADLKSGVNMLRETHSSSSNGGCFGMLLLLLSAGATGLATLVALIF